MVFLLILLRTVGFHSILELEFLHLRNVYGAEHLEGFYKLSLSGLDIKAKMNLLKEYVLKGYTQLDSKAEKFHSFNDNPRLSRTKNIVRETLILIFTGPQNHKKSKDAHEDQSKIWNHTLIFSLAMGLGHRGWPKGDQSKIEE